MSKKKITAILVLLAALIAGAQAFLSEPSAPAPAAAPSAADAGAQ